MGLTHEEPIVDMLSGYMNSYRDLPVLVYQIQTKFRNELRAQAGLLRGREFMMKDMYSFARNQEEHTAIYEEVAQAYERVYQRLGIGDITYRTYADGGIFTPRFSDEFQMLSDIGEDTVYIDEERKLGVNKEVIDDSRLADTDIDKDKLVEHRAIEVGNIFPLESKYTDALGVFYTDAEGQQQSFIAGCYGIGVSRLVGALAEHFSDDKGLVWPEEVAPFRYQLVVLGGDEAKAAAEKLYADLGEDNVLFDDRVDISAGAKFADAELIGCPIRLVVSDKTIQNGELEVRSRREAFTEQRIKLEDYGKLAKLDA